MIADLTLLQRSLFHSKISLILPKIVYFKKISRNAKFKILTIQTSKRRDPGGSLVFRKLWMFKFRIHGFNFFLPFRFLDRLARTNDLFKLIMRFLDIFLKKNRVYAIHRFPWWLLWNFNFKIPKNTYLQIQPRWANHNIDSIYWYLLHIKRLRFNRKWVSPHFTHWKYFLSF